MSEQKRDRRGTFWDWPTGWVLCGVLLLLVAGANSAPGGMAVGFVLLLLGAVLWMARAGTFSPRQRP